MEKICLAECVHYITGIDKNELVTAIYRQEKPGQWVYNLFKLVEKNGFTIRRKEKSKGQCICVLNKIGGKMSHAVILNKGAVELNPYCVDLSKYVVDYFFYIK